MTLMIYDDVDDDINDDHDDDGTHSDEDVNLKGPGYIYATANMDNQLV